MFWTTAAAFTAATAIVSGTWGLAEPVTVSGVAHAADVRPIAASCWVEKAHSVYDAEMICGDPAKRPARDTADIGEVFAGDGGYGCGWVITGMPSGQDIDGGLEYDPEPAGCN